MLAGISSYDSVLPASISFGQDLSAPRLTLSHCIYSMYMYDAQVTLPSAFYLSSSRVASWPQKIPTGIEQTFDLDLYLKTINVHYLTPKQITKLLMDLEPCTSSSRSITQWAVWTILFTSALSHTSNICK